jgi:hypothetical protein
VPVIRYVIFIREGDGWEPILAFDPAEPLQAEREVDDLRARFPREAYRLWVFTTEGHRLLRDTEKE